MRRKNNEHHHQENQDHQIQQIVLQLEEVKKTINKSKSITIDNETINYTAVSREELNAPARTTLNGIKISDDINKNDLKLQKEKIKDRGF